MKKIIVLLITALMLIVFGGCDSGTSTKATLTITVENDTDATPATGSSLQVFIALFDSNDRVENQRSNPNNFTFGVIGEAGEAGDTVTLTVKGIVPGDYYVVSYIEASDPPDLAQCGEYYHIWNDSNGSGISDASDTELEEADILTTGSESPNVTFAESEAKSLSIVFTGNRAYAACTK